MNIKLNVSGFVTEVNYTEREIHTIFYPLLEELIKRREAKNSRLLVYLAAPPGTGKTTLSLYLKRLFDRMDTQFSFQALSIDGFHQKREYLMSHYIIKDGKKVLLNNVKGSPESFNFKELSISLKNLKHSAVDWPVYDRQIHDVSHDTIRADADIVLVEGNWLLLNEDKWKELKDVSDMSIFIEADEQTLKTRLINRKIRGGLSAEEAEKFYQDSDGKNVKRILTNHFKADVVLKLTTDEELVKG